MRDCRECDVVNECGPDAPDCIPMCVRFADPGGKSALHPGKRVYPCPTCKQPNKLTIRDVRAGYQCDDCADREERGGP